MSHWASPFSSREEAEPRHKASQWDPSWGWRVGLGAQEVLFPMRH